ncbi:MAG: hypothetical protein J7493_12540 [Porphyrobacter sp.]|nr:hypothetical protein [Porphyrobacter sp.]
MEIENRYSFNPEVHKILHSRKRAFGQNWVIVKRETGFARKESNRGNAEKMSGTSFFVGRRIGSGAN